MAENESGSDKSLILGLQLRNGELLIDPVLPKHWGSFAAEIKAPAGALAIRVEDPDHIGRGIVEIVVDGSVIEGATIAFPTDGSVRRVEVRLRPPPVTADARIHVEHGSNIQARSATM